MSNKKDFRDQLLLSSFGEKPVGWSVVSLQELFTPRYELSSDVQTYPLYSFSIEDSVTPKTERYERGFLLKDQEENEFKLVYPNDFVINPMNLRFGAIGYSRVEKIVSVSAYYDVARLTRNDVDIDYLNEVLNSSRMLNIYDRIATGSLLEKRRVHYSEFKNLKIYSPPEEEQKKLGKIIRELNKSINIIETLLTAKQTHKRALRQRLLTDNQSWEKVRLGEIFEEVKDTNDGGDNHSVMTISARLGLISQKEKFDRVIAGDSLKKYTQLKKGDFAYNKGNSKLYEMGCIYQLEERASALVPFVYICFRPSGMIHSGFYKHWFLAHGLDRQLKKIITSGARGDGLLNVNSGDFFKLKIPFPPKEEQESIACVFEAVDREIYLLEKQRDAFKEQKRGLMQKLLTGKVRVKVDEAEAMEA